LIRRYLDTTMANDHNLIPAKKGEVRNPNGRPLGSRNRATVLRELSEVVLNGKSLDDKEGAFTAEQIAAAAVWRKAMEGDLNAFKEIQDTMYGKVTEKTELTGKDGNPLEVTSTVLLSSDEEIIKRYLQQKGAQDEA
jgi:hypothetical protein